MDCGGFIYRHHLRLGILGHYRDLSRRLVLRILAVERGIDVRTVSWPDAHLYGRHPFGGDGWADFGLRPNFKGNGLWWLVSVLIFPAVFTISVLIGALLGGLALNVNMFAGVVGALLTGLISAMIKNVFEEFAWRGYLAPKLYSLNMNTWLSHAIVGMIWGAWHLPFVYVFWPYLTPDMLWYFVPLLLVGTFSQSVVYGEIRLATASVLPAWVMHAIGNTIGNTLLLSNLIQLSPGKELWFSPGVESVISIILMFAVGYWLHQRRKNIEQLRL
jgi:membrane protease YdiL (CAAX protease family)